MKIKRKMKMINRPREGQGLFQIVFRFDKIIFFKWQNCEGFINRSAKIGRLDIFCETLEAGNLFKLQSCTLKHYICIKLLDHVNFRKDNQC